MSDWEIELSGEEFDLEDLPAWFTGEACKVFKREGSYFLKSDQLAFCTESQIAKAKAEALLRAVNGVARLVRANAHNVRIHGVFQVHEDETRTHFLHPGPAVVRSKVGGVLIGTAATPDGMVPVPQTPFGDVVTGMASTNLRVAGVLEVLGSEDPSWALLWVAFELIKGDPGGREILERQDPEERFKRTANSFEVLGIESRHGPQNWVPPENPMSMEEAISLIRASARLWIDSMSGGNPPHQ